MKSSIRVSRSGNSISFRGSAANAAFKAMTRKPTDYDLVLWNSMHPVGSPCEVTDDLGKKHLDKTRSVAWKLGHGEAVVHTEKFTCYILDRIRMLETHVATAPVPSEQKAAE